MIQFQQDEAERRFQGRKQQSRSSAGTGAGTWEQLTFAFRSWAAPHTIQVVPGCAENRGLSHQGESSLPPPGAVAPVGHRFPIHKMLLVHPIVLPVLYFWRGCTGNRCGRRGRWSWGGRRREKNNLIHFKPKIWPERSGNRRWQKGQKSRAGHEELHTSPEL